MIIFQTGILLLLLLPIFFLVGYGVLYWKRTSKEKAFIKEISELIISYFGHAALEVRVFAFRQGRKADFTLLIETPPISRFRHSNILEGNLIEYVEKVTGKTIEKIFWRFSLEQNLARADSISDYNNEGKLKELSSMPDLAEMELIDEFGHPYIDPSYYEVSEISFDEFKTYKPMKDILDQLDHEIERLPVKVA